jgi:hypothetical protein
METIITKAEELLARRLALLSLIEQYTAKGLGNCQNVADLKKEIEQISFDRYRGKYPSYLFLSDEHFDDVVKRNKLVISPIEAYTGYIPDQCFEAVQNENISEEDLRMSHYTLKITSSKTGKWFSFDSPISKETLGEIKKWSKEDIESEYMNCFKCTRHEAVEKLYGEDYARRPSLYSEDKDNCKFDISITCIKDYSRLYIAAPERMLDRSKESLPEKITRFKIIKQVQPLDPIVFRYVRDGILVITFWK